MAESGIIAPPWRDLRSTAPADVRGGASSQSPFDRSAVQRGSGLVCQDDVGQSWQLLLRACILRSLRTTPALLLEQFPEQFPHLLFGYDRGLPGGWRCPAELPVGIAFSLFFRYEKPALFERMEEGIHVPGPTL